MSNISLNKGTRLFLKVGTPATPDAAGYGAMTGWTQIGELESIGDFGGTGTVTSFTPLDSAVVDKRIGAIDYGEMKLPVALDGSDLGQKVCTDGFDGPNARLVHSYKITTPSSKLIYGQGVISAFTFAITGANDVQKANISLALTSPLVTDIFA